MDTEKIEMRPKGKLYIFTLTFFFLFLSVFLIIAPILFIIDKDYWALILCVLPGILTVLLIREIVRYKIVLTPTKIYLSANRTLFITYHKDLKISYKGLQSMQYILGMGPTSILMSVIVLNYEKGRPKNLDVNRFSAKQVTTIINTIKQFAEAYNSYPIEIKPDIIQKGYKRKY